MNKSKEKNKKRNTKEKNLLDLDNEIIIGIKTLPEQETKNKKKAANKKENSKKSARKKALLKEKQKTARKQSGTSSLKNRKAKQEDEFELNLGIEDESIKRKNAKANAKRKPKMTTKQQEIAKKKRKRIFRVIKWTTLVVLIIGGIIYFLLSPFFNIKSITVSGNEKITSDELISLSGIKLDENTFKISNKKVEQSIKTNAYIESVNLNRKLPDSIEIQVVERKPAYMLMLGNAYVYMNTQGYLLEVSKEALKIPVITGILTPEDQIQEGNRLCAEDLQRLNSVIQIMDSANNNQIGNLVTKINISNKQDYVLELKSEKKNVHVGDTSNLVTKMLHVKKILEKEKKKEGDIFFNTDLSNKGAIFREKV